MIIEQSEQVMKEIKKVFIGKDEIVEKVLMAIYAGGHVLLEDAPGVGKTTLALAFSRALGLSYKRVQFTPDTKPSDITGFRVYDKNTGELMWEYDMINPTILDWGLGDENYLFYLATDDTVYALDKKSLIPGQEPVTKLIVEAPNNIP